MAEEMRWRPSPPRFTQILKPAALAHPAYPDHDLVDILDTECGVLEGGLALHERPVCVQPKDTVVLVRAIGPHEDAQPIPRRVKGKLKRAAVLAIRISMGRSTVAPKPTAAPFTAAMTGFRQSKIARVTLPPPSRTRSSLKSTSSADPASCRDQSGLRRLSNASAPGDRSEPAQNARPAPVTTTTRTASSSFTRVKTSTSSFIMALVNVFSCSGRSRVSSRMPLSILTEMALYGPYFIGQP